MSDPRAAKRWMPNRMFDPVSNPFAIQNLLEKEQPQFIEARDERPARGFGLDALMSGTAPESFEVDQRLRADEEATDAPHAEGFVAEAAQPGDGFTADGFTADAAADPSARAFGTDADEAPDHAAKAAPVADAIAAQDPALDEPIAAQTDSAPPAAELHGMQSEIGGETAVAAAADPAAAEAADAENTAEIADVQAAEAAAAAELPGSESVQQMIAAARAEGYEQGMQAGLAQGREAERPVAHQQGYDEGLAAGAAQARSELQSDRQQREQREHEARLAQLQTVIDGLQQLAYDADALFEPMKQLSVHLAEQLVRGELAQSPQAISRLVDNALRELNAAGDKAVIVHLHPDDLEAYRPTVASFADSLILRPDHLLERGSVRVSLDGSVVEDLMQRRVSGLKRSLSQPAAPGWRAAGGTLSERLADGQRGSTQVEDVTLTDKAERTIETAAPADGDA